MTYGQSCSVCGGTPDGESHRGFVGRCNCTSYPGSIPKNPRYRNRAVLDHARNIDQCAACTARPEAGSIVAAHSNQSKHGKAGSYKAHDCFIAYLCAVCHDFVDAGRTDQDIAVQFWDRAHERSIPLFAHLLTAEGLRLLDRGHS